MEISPIFILELEMSSATPAHLGLPEPLPHTREFGPLGQFFPTLSHHLARHGCSSFAQASLRAGRGDTPAQRVVHVVIAHGEGSALRCLWPFTICELRINVQRVPVAVSPEWSLGGLPGTPKRADFTHLFFVEVQLVYNSVLISGVQHSASVF